MKKLICLISIIVICLGFSNITLATTLKDIKGAMCEEAVENLIEIGLVNGFEDDTYRPNETVTRAQMAKMMVVALGEEGKVENAKKQASIFIDMKSTHWAYGYINVAKELGIINGYTDGSFGPDEVVSYAEATTMAIRALGYDVEIEKSTESWPNNYISYAKKLDLFREMGSFTPGNGAPRGDTAMILWNMLRTGVCTAQSSSNSGIKYGPGKKMLNKYKNFVYMNDALITEVDFEDDFENAKVVIEDSEKLTLSLSDTDVLKLYGRNLELLYNTKSKKVVFITDTKKYTEKEGAITEVGTKKIYLDGKDYTLPSSDNILLYKAESLSDAVEATLFMSGSTVKYILASGAQNIQIGLVTTINENVDGYKGIKIKKMGSSSTTSYALIDESDMPKKYAAIIYYLNSKNELGILKEIELEDAKSIASLSSSTIKIGTKTYTYSSSDYTVVDVTTSTIKSLTFSKIEKSKDLVYLYEYAGKNYLIVFTDAVEDEDTRATAYNTLRDYINTVKSKESKEASYSQSTYAKFIDALTVARNIKSTDSTSKINAAYTELKEAYTALKAVSSSSEEGKIAAKRAELRKLISNEAATVVSNKSKYTANSYGIFDDALDDAKDLLKDSTTTKSEVTDAYNKLYSAIKEKLVLLTATQEHKDALKDLNDALERSKTVGAKENYVEATYNKYKTAYDTATSIKNNSSSKTSEEIKSAANKLNEAITDLKPAIDALKDILNELIVESLSYKDSKDDYLPEVFKVFEDAFEKALEVRESTDLTTVQNAVDTLKKSKEDLSKAVIDDILTTLKADVAPIKNAPQVAEVLKMPEEKPEDKLDKIKNIKDAVVNDLKSLIRVAQTEIGTYTGDDLVKLLDTTAEAQKALDLTLKDMVAVYVKLDALV